MKKIIKCGYIAVDLEDGCHFFKNKPERDDIFKWWYCDGNSGMGLPLNMSLGVNWDDEPVKVKITIEKVDD